MNREGGVYVHIPFCRRRCIYCDFYSEGERRADWSRLVSALLRECDERCVEGGELTDCRRLTLYVGGGTPSLMPIDEMRRLVGGIRDILRKALGEEPTFVESTIEVNPDDVTEELAAAWRAMGFTRVSMGVQSFEDGELKVIGRRHNAAQAVAAYEILRRHFENVSLDLMFGLPGQTLESLSRTVDRILQLRPEHISAYSLMYEERTALTRMRDAGELEEADDDCSVSMFELLSRRLAEVGYQRYEISNYSLPGRESQHNSAYWRGVRYVGLGPSAHSYDGDRCRRWNIADVRKYIVAVEQGECFNDSEVLDLDELREEMLMTRLRCRSGLNLSEYGERFGAVAKMRLESIVDKEIRRGMMARQGDAVMLSEEGIMVSDEIISNLF